jgi:hypothetical protein
METTDETLGEGGSGEPDDVHDYLCEVLQAKGE